MKIYFKSLFEEQSEERFFSLKLTKLVLWSFGFVFVITFTISLFDAVTLEFKPTSEGVNYLVFELFKAPVAVAGFALPILGLIGLNHRSEQTKKQIFVAKQQNIFTNYFKHLEEFTKHVDKHLGRQLDEVSIRKVHDAFFPKAYKDGDFTLCDEVLNDIFSNIIIIKQAFQAVKVENELVECLSLFHNCVSLEKNLGLKHIFSEVEDVEKKLFKRTAKENLARAAFEHYEELWEFCRVLIHIASFSNDDKLLVSLSEQANEIEQDQERIKYKVLPQLTKQQRMSRYRVNK